MRFVRGQRAEGSPLGNVCSAAHLANAAHSALPPDPATLPPERRHQEWLFGCLGWREEKHKERWTHRLMWSQQLDSVETHCLVLRTQEQHLPPGYIFFYALTEGRTYCLQTVKPLLRSCGLMLTS